MTWDASKAGKELSAHRRELASDLINEMSAMNWRQRRSLVSRILQITLVASRLKAQATSSAAVSETIGKCRPQTSEPASAIAQSHDVLGDALATVIASWDEQEVDCEEQAYIWALSAEAEHQKAAFRWYALHSPYWIEPRPRAKLLN